MLSHDSRLRCNFVDLYYVLYGTRRPLCIPIPELAAILSVRHERHASPTQEKEVSKLLFTHLFSNTISAGVYIPQLHECCHIASASLPILDTEHLAIRTLLVYYMFFTPNTQSEHIVERQ